SQLHEWLNFISAEIHGGFGPLFNRDLPEAARAWWQARLEKRLEHVATALRERQALVQDRYGLADIYLY
ncbi:glutathione transferase GstA, partial [Escherichia coli]|nr:glutathione transferase GstA [Escherichia coli]